MEKICPKCHLDQEFTDSRFKITSSKCKSYVKLRNLKYYENNWALDNLRPYPAKQNVMDGKGKL